MRVQGREGGWGALVGPEEEMGSGYSPDNAEIEALVKYLGIDECTCSGCVVIEIN